MWLNESSSFKYLNGETVKKAEDKLQLEINELKKEIETNELVYGLTFTRPFSSVPAPRDAQHLARERKLHIEHMLSVPDTRPTYVQADVMLEQLDCAVKCDYTFDSLPLLLHQFFLDKISWSIQAKHAHMLRWKRFAEHTSVIEDLYVYFKNRIAYILSDYNDSIQRVRRLSTARDHLLSSGTSQQAASAIRSDDVEIYLRWLVAHFYSQKSFQQALKVLEWLPHHMSLEQTSAELAAQSTSSASTAAADNDQHDANQPPYSHHGSYQHQPASASKKYSQTSIDIQVDAAPDESANSSFYKSASNASPKMPKSSSATSILINKSKLLDKLYLPGTNAMVPFDEVVNAISYSKKQNKIEFFII